MLRLGGNIRIGLLVGVSGLSLAACASGNAMLDPRYPTRSGAPTGQARAEPRSPAPGGSTASSHTGGTWKPYQINGRWYYPAEQPDYDETGLASWYGPNFDGKSTADGEIYDMMGLSAAHKTLPLPSLVEVTNLDNGRRVVVRVNDRGPFVDDRLIDLSRGAAEQLGMMRAGLAHVRVRYIGPADDFSRDRQVQMADASLKPAPSRKPPPVPANLPQRSPDPLPASALAMSDIPDLPQAAPEPLPAPSSALASIPGLPASAPTPVAEPPPSAPEALPAAVVPARYVVQAGAFAVRANAERAGAQLAGLGQVEITPLERAGGVLYRVSVRPAEGAAADETLRSVAASGYGDARLIAGN